MDLITGQRTYVLGVSGLISAHHPHFISVPFTDTAGNVIRCNYCSCELIAGNSQNKQQGLFLELSGPPRQGDMESDGIQVFNDDGNLTNLSGVLGMGVGGNSGDSRISEWHASNGEVATGAKIQVVSEDGVYLIILRYGNLYPLNTLRLEQSYDKGV